MRATGGQSFARDGMQSLQMATGGQMTLPGGQLYQVARMFRADSRPGNLKFEETQAGVAFPAVFENSARAVVRGAYAEEPSWLPPFSLPVLTNRGKKKGTRYISTNTSFSFS